jgi:PST family polysaccharide transporter
MTETMQTSRPSPTGLAFVWASAGIGGQVLFQVLALVVLARLLSPAEFGVVSAATIITQLSLILNEFGIGPAIVQRELLTEEDIRVGFTLSCLLALLMALGLWLGAPWLGALFQIPELTWVIRAYTLIFLLKGYSAVAESLLHRELAFRLLARADTISFSVGYAGVGIVSAVCGLSYWSLVLAHLSQSAIKAWLVLRYRTHCKDPHFDRANIKAFLHFGVGQSISRLGSYVANQGDSVVVAKFLGVERLGEYGRAGQLVVMPSNQIGAVFDKVLFPTFSLVQGNMDRFRAAYDKSLTLIAMLGLPVSALFFVSARDLTYVMLGENWSNVAEPMKILALGIVFRLLHKISDPTARAVGMVYQRAWRQTLVAGILLGGSYLGSAYGLVGVAYGVLIATVLDALLMVQLCSNIAGLGPKSVGLALLPGVRLGLITLVVAFTVQHLTSRIMNAHVGILITTVALSGLTLWLALYLIPRLGIGQRGIEVMDYVWSAFHLERWFGMKAPTL